jgi:hypothetical protein
MHRFRSRTNQFAVLAVLFVLNGCDTQQGASVTSGTPGDPERKPSTSDVTVAIPIVYYETGRIDDGKEGDRHLTYENFLDVRLDLRAACDRHGATGPDSNTPARDRVFFLVDDFYNDWERYQYVEICKASGMTRRWLVDVMAVLREHVGWRLGIGGLAEGYAIVFADRIMVTGEVFRACVTMDQFISTAQKCLQINDLMERADDERLEALSWIATHRERLDLHNATITDEGLVHIRAFAKLVSLDMHGTGITDAGLTHLAGLTTLRELNLTESHITDQGLLHLKSLPNLKRLILDDTSIEGHLFAELTPLTQLEELWLQSTKVDDEGLRQLQGLPWLKMLQLSYASITDDGLKYLEPLADLEELSLVGLPVTDSGLSSLLPLRKLRELSLTRTAVTDDGVATVASLPKLEALYLDDTGITDRALEHLAGLKSLKTVFVHHTKVSDSGIDRLRQVIPGAWVASERK